MSNTNFNFENLNASTRTIMVSEIQSDIDNKCLYMSRRFNENGIALYPKLLFDSVSNGTEQTLAIELKKNNCFLLKEPRTNPNGKITFVNVPETANLTFAESEFNRFYMRALAVIAMQQESKLEIYRSKFSINPRPESTILIGTTINPESLLKSLRDNKTNTDGALGLPTGPNSGLSVKLL